MTNYTILDCYTDEPAGLGVPPYLGTYARYIAGSLDGDVKYLTIDDLRLFKKYNLQVPIPKDSQKTDISVYNFTKNNSEIQAILENTDELIIIAGVHTPGKYLSAIPASIKEVINLIKDLNCKKILTGPAVYGTSVEGGKFSEKFDLSSFDEIKSFDFNYSKIKDLAIKGANIINQIDDLRVIEIETSRGCSRKKGCSFCTEPIKNKLAFRDFDDIILEIEEFYKLGARYFRLGKQSCFYAYTEPVKLLKTIRDKCPDLKMLHIDNVNPANVVGEKGEDITKAIVKYCTSGNIAAFGVESFDPVVVKDNNLNSNPDVTYEAVKIINKYGAKRGENGMPLFLPGINILFGLKGESRKTNDENIKWLKRFLDEGLLVRRINVRQVMIFENTDLYETCGNKFIKKNKKYYWSWRKNIRTEIDYPMLQKLTPVGTVLKDVRAEIYDGKTTFARQVGTYPLIVGIEGRIPLNEFYDIEVTGHMLRSIKGKVIQN